MRFDGKTVLVTGGAVRVGAAVARAFAAEGAALIVHCRYSRAAAEALVAELPGRNHRIVEADLEKPGAAETLFRQIEGPVDILINNASRYRRFESVLKDSEEEDRRFFQVNYLAPVALMAFCPLIIAMNGEARLLSDYASLLAFFLMGCVFLAIGMFLSSLTESQIIAAVSTFAVLLVLFLWDDLVSFLPDALGGLLSAFSFTQVFYNFVQYSVFDLKGLVLYLSLTFLFLFLTVQTLQKRRWD